MNRPAQTSKIYPGVKCQRWVKSFLGREFVWWKSPFHREIRNKSLSRSTIIWQYYGYYHINKDVWRMQLQWTWTLEYKINTISIIIYSYIIIYSDLCYTHVGWLIRINSKPYIISILVQENHNYFKFTNNINCLCVL